jgi:hypothetical protein
MLKAMAGMFTETRDAVKDVRTIYHLSDLYKSQTEKYQKMYNSAKQCSRDLNVMFLSFSFVLRLICDIPAD